MVFTRYKFFALAMIKIHITSVYEWVIFRTTALLSISRGREMEHRSAHKHTTARDVGEVCILNN